MKRKTQRRLALLLTALMLLSLTLLSGCGKKDAGTISAPEQLDRAGRKIGVPADTADDRLVSELFPQAEIEYYKDEISGYTSVSQGKLDAFVYSKLAMETAIYNGMTGVRLLDDSIGEGYTCAVGISPRTAIPDLEGKLNAFIDGLKADGTMDEMVRRWFVRHEETMPAFDIPESAEYHLTVGTTGSSMPFTYYLGTELWGYDVELAYRFAAWLGATLEFKVYDYGGIVAAAQAGDIDCIFAGLFVTPERAEALAFSHPTYIDEIGVMVRADEPSYESGSVLATLRDGASAQGTLAELAHASIGVATGTVFPDIVSEYLPEAEIVYFNTTADQINALKSGKIAAFMQDSPVARNMMAEDAALTVLPEELGWFDFAYIFPKSERGAALCGELSEFLRALKADGTLEALQHKWFDGNDPGAADSLDYRGLPAERGTIRVSATEYPPFVLSSEGVYRGYDIELLTMFCQEEGYAMEIDDLGMDGSLPAVQSGKYDLGCSGFTVTEERKETLYFSEPNYSGGAALVVLRDGAAQSGGFWQRVAQSFEKTFVRESRWKLFVSGVGTTLLITVLSIVLGTALGFGAYLLCRGGNPIANGLARFLVWLVQGMPMVVLLMILYYLIFGSVAISGTLVAIIGFTLVFGAAVFGMLKSGVGAVDRGQLDAAYALGYSDRKAFFRVVLPQALPHFFPAYKGEITAIIKATAIVGYVAVQDLTKMGDIVRSRTYEAFFPLIAVAVIYFILAGILTAIVNRLGVYVDPRRRKKEDILKGVSGT